LNLVNYKNENYVRRKIF